MLDLPAVTEIRKLPRQELASSVGAEHGWYYNLWEPTVELLDYIIQRGGSASCSDTWPSSEAININQEFTALAGEQVRARKLERE